MAGKRRADEGHSGQSFVLTRSWGAFTSILFKSFFGTWAGIFAGHLVVQSTTGNVRGFLDHESVRLDVGGALLFGLGVALSVSAIVALFAYPRRISGGANIAPAISGGYGDDWRNSLGRPDGVHVDGDEAVEPQNVL